MDTLAEQRRAKAELERRERERQVHEQSNQNIRHNRELALILS
jgi:hypothetical protein